MAGLIGLTSSDVELQDALGLVRFEYDGTWIPHPVVRLTTTLPVAVKRDGDRVGVRARWGFDVGAGRPIGNARDDKLQISPMWSKMLGKSPCLVAATGVYEMAEYEGAKTPLWFRRVDRKPIIMPGLAGERGAAGERRLCCAIVTTEPNDFFGQFHDRQVCVLSDEEAGRWLEAGPDDAPKLLHAPKNEEWEAVPVDGRIFRHGRVEIEHLVETGKPVRWTA